MPRVFTTKRFDREFARLSKELQKLCAKALVLLADNPHHPSLRVKKMQGHPDIWEARLSEGYRVTFNMDGDVCILRRVGPHDVLGNP